MALVSTVETHDRYRHTYLPEANAVGEAGQSLRNSSENDLRKFLADSIYWKNSYLRQAAYSKLCDLLMLKTNWDSYGAPSPSRRAFDNALLVLKSMRSSDLEALSIVPSAEGGIGLCFRREERYADIEALNDGSILGVRYLGMETPVLIDVDGTANSISVALEEIRNHIGI
jgi:hypothetical protein